MSDTSSMGAYEAKTHFAELLERVAGGEEVTITRHGVPVARVVPIGPSSSIEERRKAITAIKGLAQQNDLGGLAIKDLIAEGRR